MIKKLLILIAVMFVLPQTVGATAYYIDFVNGDDNAAGTATTTAWQSLDQFTENARSAGDIAFARRGVASTTNVSDLTFTSDGEIGNPITLSADYDALWPQDFADSAQTYTPVFGAKTMEASATITGISANQWIYVVGDCTERYGNEVVAPTTNVGVNPCEYAYEVSAVSGTTLTLYLPYKGPTTGGGNSLRVMAAAPQWNVVTGDFRWIVSADNYWVIQGFDVRGTDANCTLIVSASVSRLLDMIVQTDGVSACSLTFSSGRPFVNKMRGFGGSFLGNNDTIGPVTANNIHHDCNSVSSTSFIHTNNYLATPSFKNIEVVNCTNLFTGAGTAFGTGGSFFFRNTKHNNTYSTLSGQGFVNFHFEDNFSIIGDNVSFGENISSNTTASTTVSTTTNLRSGGGAKNLVVFPPTSAANTGISTRSFPHSYIKLFEYPIYTDTSSKTYTMYFNSLATANWTADPFTSTQTSSSTPELYIECEYYAAASGADRRLKRSSTAGAAQFSSVTTWEDISVTCQPSQTGILYLRGWYAKPSDGDNTFYMDTTPEVS